MSFISTTEDFHYLPGLIPCFHIWYDHEIVCYGLQAHCSITWSVWHVPDVLRPHDLLQYGECSLYFSPEGIHKWASRLSSFPIFLLIGLLSGLMLFSFICVNYWNIVCVLADVIVYSWHIIFWAGSNIRILNKWKSMLFFPRSSGDTNLSVICKINRRLNRSGHTFNETFDSPRLLHYNFTRPMAVLSLLFP